jgi:phage shock protein A
LCFVFSTLGAGALFGASLGSNLGAKNAADRARREEMERLGISQDMLDTAREVGLALERSAEGLRATRDSLETQQRLARRLEDEAGRLYGRAKEALASGEEEKARKLLLSRQQDLDKLKQVLLSCADDKQRLETMERNVAALERRAMEVEALLKRTIGAKSQVDASAISGRAVDDDARFALSSEDPLLQKFRDMGID